ncbi:MAG: ankyrin repeat domain-containing protein [Synergistaceae bacterium]|nr:ankyrin repeat domain-containing protein [Synergistaceae bacterium]
MKKKIFGLFLVIGAVFVVFSAPLWAPRLAEASTGATEYLLEVLDNQKQKLDEREIKRLLENGAEVNDFDKSGFTPLMLALRRDPNIKIIRLLLDKGANVNARGADDLTPLMVAARYSTKADIFKLLKKKGANIDDADASGRTPLLWAAGYNKKSEILKLLIETYKADTSAEDDKGLNVWDYAKKNRALSGTDIDSYIERVFRERGKTVKKAADPSVFTPRVVDGAQEDLFIAIQNKDLERIETLRGKVNLYAENREGKNPLMLVLENDEPKMLELLLSPGFSPEFDINRREKWGTPVSYAAQYGDSRTLQILLDAGADVTEADWIAAGKNARIKNSSVYPELRGKFTTEKYPAKGQSVLSDQGHLNRELLDVTQNPKARPSDIAGLIREGADVNAVGVDGKTPLINAAEVNKNPEVLIVLIQARANVNARDKKGNTPLRMAAQNNVSEIVELLLTNGAKFEEGDFKAAQNNEYLLKNTRGYRQLQEKYKRIPRAKADNTPKKPNDDAYQKGAAFYRKGDYQAAYPLLLQAANEKHPAAQNYLGAMFSNGYGVGKDPKTAVSWYQKAANAGYRAAQYNLGMCYKNAYGVAQDLREARIWLRKAADAGDKDAEEALRQF